MSGLVTLAYDQIAPGSVRTATEQAGYPASNVLLGKVGRPWKGLGHGTAFLIVDLGASKYVDTFAANNGNLVEVGIRYDDTGAFTSLIQTTTGGTDKQGRWKASFQIKDTFRYLQLTMIASGLPTDGDDVWSLSSLFFFANSLSLARDPLFGESATDVNFPQSRVDLDNGSTVKDDTGPSFMTPTLQFSGGRDDDHEQLVRLTRAGLCWLNYNDGNPGDQWPVRHVDPKITRKLAAFNRESVQVSLKEQT